jgi:hypothetical protein
MLTILFVRWCVGPSVTLGVLVIAGEAKTVLQIEAPGLETGLPALSAQNFNIVVCYMRSSVDRLLRNVRGTV